MPLDLGFDSLLQEYAAGDLLSLCAAAGVDTTAQLCNRGCQPHGSSGSRFGTGRGDVIAANVVTLDAGCQ